jgi:hypothetical protein
MKKIIYGLCLLLSVHAIAQEKYAPVIKQGLALHYAAFVNGQNFPCIFSLDSVAADYVRVGWNVEGFGSGSWVMKKKSLDNGTRGYWSQPTPGTQEEMGDDQTVLLFSRAQWDALQKDKKINFDQQTYTVKTPSETQQLKISGKMVDAIYLENQNNTTRIWLLNNATFPVLLKIEGNTLGADLTLNSVE